MKDTENKVVELSDEALANVGGGYTPSDKLPGIACDSTCETCTPASAIYQNCPTREYGSSVCKYNR